MKIPAFYIPLGFSVALASDLATNIKMVAIAAVVGPVLLVFRKLPPEMGSLMKVFDPLFKILADLRTPPEHSALRSERYLVR